MVQLPPTAAAKLQSTLLETGLPPPEATRSAILFMLNRVDWAESLLSIDNTAHLKANDQSRLLADLESLCTA